MNPSFPQFPIPTPSPQLEIPPITPQTRFWKIAPGENAHFWNRCRTGGFIGIGWPELGDVRGLTRSEFEIKRDQIVGHNGFYTPGGMEQVWKFAKDIRPGDRIIANRGFSEVVGLGVFTGPCEYVDGVHYRHRLPTHWFDVVPRQVEQKGWVRTLIALNREQFEAIAALPPLALPSFWKFSPPSAHWSWEMCIQESLIALGFNGLGDVAELHPDEFKSERDKLLAKDTTLNKADLDSVWLLTQLPLDAQIVATQRQSGKVLGRGHVRGIYSYQHGDSPFKHRVPVEWENAPTLGDDTSSRRKTLEEISAELFQNLTSEKMPRLLPEAPQKIPARSIPMKPQQPLNQILYGPPGTGKTFHSIARAVAIIDGEAPSEAPSDRKACKERFEELREAKQIEFVTFHQSFSYEEFIEGLRPVLEEEGDGDGQVRYQIRDGVLKQMAQRAISSAYATPSLRSFETAWAELRARVASGEITEVEGLTSDSRYKLVFVGERLEGENVLSPQGPRSFFTTRLTQQTAWERLPAGVTIKSSQFRQLQLDREGNIWFDAVIHNNLKALALDEEGKPNFHQAPRFVLIIDEINRGNISKILGELITLLEEDKRLGNPNALHVTLPVSQDRFSLPPNLYVLGTMNTADKSLALLDVALRRRFSFAEMPPRSELFPDFARETLQKLNLRLEAVLDREHRLGHAYFIDCHNEASFNRVFRDKIIPLLQEFFYNDWETLRAVLGESGKDGKKGPTFIKELPAIKGLKSRTKWRWWFDTEGASGEGAGKGADFNYLAVLAANYANSDGGDAVDGEAEDGEADDSQAENQ